jgi:uncharacterized membrane protein
MELTEHRGKEFSSNKEHEVVTLPPAGASDRGMGINNRGWVAGFTAREDGSREAILWLGERVIELGTLGGPSSMVPWPGVNDWGMVVGISHTGEVDSLNEGWSCEEGAFLPQTNPRQICRGFFSAWGTMYELPTLGGTHGFAAAVNNRGQVVGWAETPVHDPTCVGIQVLQFKAVMWEPLRGKTHELSPFPGDSASAATAINARGQAVGISGDCDQAVGRFSARRAVIWQHGSVQEIPNLGGTTWHTPMDINERGDVVGFSNPEGEGDPEGAFIAHAFYWRHGSDRVKDLGVLDGDGFSQAMGINNRGDIVGVSFGGDAGPRGVIWRNGRRENLNDLVDIGDDVILSAQHINDRRQITGRLTDSETGRVVAFVATPKRHRRHR